MAYLTLLNNDKKVTLCINAKKFSQIFSAAHSVFKATVELNAFPGHVFEIFEDAEDLPKWAPSIQNVEWTSSKLFGLGSTRSVSMADNLVGDEVFIEVEYPKRQNGLVNLL